MTPEMKRAIEQNRWVEGTQHAQRFSIFACGFEGVVIVRRIEWLGKKEAFRVELEVETSNIPEQPVRSIAPWLVKLIDKDAAFQDIATWAAACGGYEGKDTVEKEVLPILQELLRHATHYPENNEFIGVRVRLKTVCTQTEKGELVRYDFSPVKVLNAAEVCL